MRGVYCYDYGRVELLDQVERSCEIKAVNAVNSSPAYQVLCETLQKARAEAEAKLKRVDATQNHDAVFQSMLQKVRGSLIAIAIVHAEVWAYRCGVWLEH